MSAPRNRTLTLTDDERLFYRKRLKHVAAPVACPEEILDSTIVGDVARVAPFLPSRFVDLLFVDPPYNMNKRFNASHFSARSTEAYAAWMDAWLSLLVRCLKPEASVYICGDWKSSMAIELVAQKYFTIRNRITWEREKGRGARTNWKNASEDIWFATAGDSYTFELERVKLKRRVRAPYRHANGEPKDWRSTESGDFRLTHPSNLWTDLTVPFWSMPENTEHPTQKPEKLLAKIILASSHEGGVVLDPFAGSGTAQVVAKKLGRHYVGIEIDERFACLAEKRLERAAEDRSIQGLRDGVFFERNSGI